MPAKIKSALFKPLDFPNPFLEGSADKAYADILGDKMKEARWWRITGAGCLVLFALSLFMLSRAVNMQQTVPVLVNVMPTGEAVSFLFGGSIICPASIKIFLIRLVSRTILSSSVS